MIDEQVTDIDKIIKEKEIRIQELEDLLDSREKKIKETEQILFAVDSKLEKKVVDRTIEVNKLLIHTTRFIDNLSHDLATPLTPLISLLPLIKEELKDSKSQELVDICIRNVEYIKRVVNNTKELAEINSLDMILKKENLFEIVDELIKKYEAVFNTCKVQVQNNIAEDIFVKTEREKLLKLFDHVCSNAVNAMKEGGTITFESKDVTKDDNSFIQISVTDTGAGLTREQTDKLFEAFYKTDDSRHKLDSTGLGLTICKRIIEKHGGKIWADSHGPGTGTSIHFTLPSSKVVFTRSF